MSIELIIAALSLTVFLLLVIIIQLLRSPKKSSSDYDKQIGELVTYVSEIKNTHSSIESMLRSPQQRGIVGELSLEELLKDQLSPSLYKIRSKLPNGKVPDAQIISEMGIICIDSKFPLDNYLELIKESNSNKSEKLKRDFIKNVTLHLEKIRKDYIDPNNKTADFAFAYIPSESVYYFLQTEALNTLRDFAKRGVQTTSPITLTQKIELIKTNFFTKNISRNAENIKESLISLKSHFDELDVLWSTLYDRHIRNTISKAGELDKTYSKLKEDFFEISKL